MGTRLRPVARCCPDRREPASGSCALVFLARPDHRGRACLRGSAGSAPGVGLLSGGYGSDELERVGAYRVSADPADLLAHLDEIGVRQHEDWTDAPPAG